MWSCSIKLMKPIKLVLILLVYSEYEKYIFVYCIVKSATAFCFYFYSDNLINKT